MNKLPLIYSPFRHQRKKSPADQFIFQRRTSTPTESSGHDESSSLYVELGLTDSETNSDEEVPGMVARVQAEGQAGPNPGEHDEGQARGNGLLGKGMGELGSTLGGVLPEKTMERANTFAEYMILSGADNRPPMLHKDLYDSWKSRMKLYMQNRENRRMILELVEHGLLIWPTIEENGVIRTKKYAKLSAVEKIQADCDIKFVTDVKLVKDLHTTNFDLLHAYLEQHELHENNVRLLRERNQDPLAFVANQQMTPPHFNTYQSSYNNPQLQQEFSPSQYGSIPPTQHYSSTYPSQP
ncbi:hypothetical protein Tco_0783297 [Tanacetum coccineum]